MDYHQKSKNNVIRQQNASYGCQDLNSLNKQFKSLRQTKSFKKFTLHHKMFQKLEENFQFPVIEKVVTARTNICSKYLKCPRLYLLMDLYLRPPATRFNALR